MNEDLLSFINKLPPRHTMPALRVNGLKVESRIKEIRERFPDLDEPKAIALGVFTQHLNLSLFTDVELLAVASLRIDLLTANPNERLPIRMYPDRGLYDTGSARSRAQLQDLQLDFNQLDFMLARSSKTIHDIMMLEGI